MQASLIIAAGGTSTRFWESFSKRAHKRSSHLISKDSSLPQASSKLFLPLRGKPLIAHTISAFQKFPEIRETVIAVAPGMEKDLRRMIREFRWRDIKLVRGGRRRAESVWKALNKTNRRHEWILVHDGARPFISSESVRKLFQSVKGVDGAVLVKKVIPTIKEMDKKLRVRRTVDRSVLCEAETPQLVRRAVLKRAYEKTPNAFKATDESALLESMNASVRVVPHLAWNPKVTTAQDFELAKAMIENRNLARIRTGLGFDTHRLVLGRKFYLGGVRIPFERGALGHSDGDALLHAISDAILGVMGSGDIGEWFSDRDPKFKGIRSEKILKTVNGQAMDQGWKVQHVDSVVLLERPKLSPYKGEIRRKIASILSLPVGAVSVKAKTMEGLGPIGGGHAVTCQAIVTMTRGEP